MTGSNTFADPQDSARAVASYDLLRADIEALAAAHISPPWLSLSEASQLAWRLAELASEPARLQRLKALGSEFDVANITRLNHVGWAYFHIQAQCDDAGATHTAAQIPKELWEDAAALNQDIMRILTYNLADFPDAAAKLASIRSGIGYHDTARDLHRLAALCDEHQEWLLNDGNHYQADMPTRARELAARILQELAASQTAAVAHWSDHRARCFTLLRDAYDDVRLTCEWLHRKEPEQAAAFGPFARTSLPGYKPSANKAKAPAATQPDATQPDANSAT